MRTVENLVIGGGISGLSTAWQLAQQGNQVELWEAQSHLGGKIATDTDNNSGYTTEQAASMVLNFRPEVSRFLAETGLDEYKLLRTPTSKRYLISQGMLQEMPMKIAGVLFSPLWSLSGKLRLMLEPFILKGGGEHESVADFIRRRFGHEMLDKALGAYVSGTLASDPEKADSFSVLPQLTGLEQRYGSLTAGIFARKVINKKKASVTEGFSFQGGMSTMINELTQQLGSRIHTQYQIIKIVKKGGGWVVTAKTPYKKSNGEQNQEQNQEQDRNRNKERSCFTKNLILSTPAPVTAKLLKAIDSDLSQLLDEIEYAPVSVIHLGYKKTNIKHDVDGTGFLTPFKESPKLNGSMWMHSLFSGRAPENHVLLSNYIGGSRHPELVKLPEQEQIDLVHKELSELLGIKGKPEWAKVNTHAQALPLYHGEYALRQQMIKQQLISLPNLYLQANYLGGVSIRDRIVCARSLAKQLTAKEKNHCNQYQPSA